MRGPGSDYPQRRSGSSRPAAGSYSTGTHGVTSSLHVGNGGATSGRETFQAPIPPTTVLSAPRPVASTSRTDTACTTSPATCGSGVRTGSAVTSTPPARYAAIPSGHRLGAPASYVAAPICATTHTATGTASLPGQATPPTARPATWAFAAPTMPDRERTTDDATLDSASECCGRPLLMHLLIESVAAWATRPAPVANQRPCLCVATG